MLPVMMGAIATSLRDDTLLPLGLSVLHLLAASTGTAVLSNVTESAGIITSRFATLDGVYAAVNNRPALPDNPRLTPLGQVNGIWLTTKFVNGIPVTLKSEDPSTGFVNYAAGNSPAPAGVRDGVGHLVRGGRYGSVSPSPVEVYTTIDGGVMVGGVVSGLDQTSECWYLGRMGGLHFLAESRAVGVANAPTDFRIWKSTDGVNWAISLTTTGQYAERVRNGKLMCYGLGDYWIFFDNGNCYRSSDATAWIPETTIPKVAGVVPQYACDGKTNRVNVLFATPAGYEVWSTLNKILWAKAASPILFDWDRPDGLFAFSGGWLYKNALGTIYTSDDFLMWNVK